MAESKKIKEWRHIFLDTSVIIDLFQNPERLDKNKEHQRRVIDTKLLLNLFETKNQQKNIQYRFYISTITIAELIAITGFDLHDKLITIFKSGFVTYIDFSKEIAFYISNNVKEFVPNYTYNQYVKHLKRELKADNQILNARNWIEDDIKIACSAKYIKKIDIVLTADKKTFVPICKKLNIPYMDTSKIPKDLFNDISTL